MSPTATANAVFRATNGPTQLVINLLSGRAWGDLPILFRLEAGLGIRLWVNADLPTESQACAS